MTESRCVFTDIKVLRNYIEIIDSGSITAAAKKLFIAQPALSNQLKGLEKELGTTLIERTSHHQEATYSGKLFYERAKHIVEMENGIKTDIAKYEKRQIGTLRLGITPYTAITLFDGILKKFCEMHPDIRFELYEHDSGKLIELLETKVIDAAIVRTPCRIPKGAEASFLENDSWIAVYSDSFTELDVEGEYISLKELNSIPLTFIRRHQDIFMRACDAAAFVPNVRCVNVQLFTVFVWAKTGLAVGITPLTSVEYIKSEGLKYKKIKDDIFSVKRAIVTNVDTDMPVICRDFIDFSKKELGIL